MLAVNPSVSAEQAVGAGSLQFSTTMPITGPIGVYRYAFTSNVSCWIAQGANPTATAGSGSMFVPANTIIIIDGFWGAKLAVIEDSTAGKASLTAVSQ